MSDKKEKDTLETSTVTVGARATVPAGPPCSVAHLRKAFPKDEQVGEFLLKQITGTKKPLTEWVKEFTQWKAGQ